MIDTHKYEGHTEGPWEITCFERKWYVDAGGGDAVCRLWGKAQRKDPTARLIADAPLLLEEVKRLRKLLVKGSDDYTTSYMDLRGIIEDVHYALTGDDVHYSQSDNARITYALGILSEVVG